MLAQKVLCSNKKERRNGCSSNTQQSIVSALCESFTPLFQCKKLCAFFEQGIKASGHGTIWVDWFFFISNQILTLSSWEISQIEPWHFENSWPTPSKRDGAKVWMYHKLQIICGRFVRFLMFYSADHYVGTTVWVHYHNVMYLAPAGVVILNSHHNLRKEATSFHEAKLLK